MKEREEERGREREGVWQRLEGGNGWREWEEDKRGGGERREGEEREKMEGEKERGENERTEDRGHWTERGPKERGERGERERGGRGGRGGRERRRGLRGGEVGAGAGVACRLL
eukprot:1768620-Rhodomonas_salina.1